MTHKTQWQGKIVTDKTGVGLCLIVVLFFSFQEKKKSNFRLGLDNKSKAMPPTWPKAGWRFIDIHHTLTVANGSTAWPE